MFGTGETLLALDPRVAGRGSARSAARVAAAKTAVARPFPRGCRCSAPVGAVDRDGDPRTGLADLPLLRRRLADALAPGAGRLRGGGRPVELGQGGRPRHRLCRRPCRGGNGPDDLAQSVHDRAVSQFLRVVQDRAERTGRVLVTVAPARIGRAARSRRRWAAGDPRRPLSLDQTGWRRPHRAMEQAASREIAHLLRDRPSQPECSPCGPGRLSSAAAHPLSAPTPGPPAPVPTSPAPRVVPGQRPVRRPRAARRAPVRGAPSRSSAGRAAARRGSPRPRRAVSVR